VQALAVTGPINAAELASLPLPERYIISQCHSLVGSVTSQVCNHRPNHRPNHSRYHRVTTVCPVTLQLQTYDFGPAGQAIYAFLWDEYADWYLEISKRRIGGDDPLAAAQARRTLVYVLDSCLRLLHPYMPFITEELWQKLPHAGDSLMISRWPVMDEDEALPLDSDAVDTFESMRALVRSVRNARAEYRVEPAKKISAAVVASPSLAAEVEKEADALAFLARVAPGALSVSSSSSSPSSTDAASSATEPAAAAVRLVVADGLEAYLPLADMVGRDRG
jgi:valyl-tRNA synthetase